MSDTGSDIELAPDVRERVEKLTETMRFAPRVAIGLVILGALALMFGLFRFSSSSEDLDRLGSFAAGLVASLWSLAGIVLIFTAFAGQQQQIVLQQEELRLNRVELKDTRKELRGQKEALEEQGRIAREQQLESTFFQMVRLHNDIVQALDVSDSYGPSKGRHAFAKMNTKVKELYAFLGQKNNEPLDEAYNLFYTEFGPHVGHYFRNLYHIVKFVHTSGFKEPHRYTAILRAQLSTNELLLLFYNGLSRFGRDKFKPLVEEYSLLQTMPEQLVVDPALLERYQRRAFDPSAPAT
jgi:hypothetical protein